MPETNEKVFFDKVSEYWESFKGKVSNYFKSNKDDTPKNNMRDRKPDHVSRRVKLQDMNNEMVSPLIKDMMVEEMAQAQTEQYIDAQKHFLHETIEKITEYKKKYEPYEKLLLNLYKELGEKMENSGYKKALEELTKNNISFEPLEKINEIKEKYGIAQMEEEIERKLKQKYNELGLTGSDRLYANKLTGLGEGENNYCIAIQTNAMRLASKQCEEITLNQVKDGMGWTCDYASSFFNKAGFADNYDKKNAPFVEVDGKWVVKKDENKKPLVNDGDMCIVDNFHCIRFNVDKEGVVSYSAGNKERIEAKSMDWICESPITIIKTSDYAKSLLENEYKGMSNEEILEKYKEFKAKKGENDFFFTINANNRDDLKRELTRDRNAKLAAGVPISQNENDARNRRNTISRFESKVDLRNEQRQNEPATSTRASFRRPENINWLGFRQRD